MNNRELAELIYVDLNIKGADLGNASIGIIEKTLNECKVKNLTIPDVSNNEVAVCEHPQFHILGCPFYNQECEKCQYVSSQTDC